MSAPTAIIAEDEPLLRAELRELLAGLWPELSIVAEANDGVAAMRMLDAQAPDILFLDIEMPGMTGLDVARQASGRCHVVFVTAYDKYAIPAFEHGAIDYVLKPFSSSRIASTVTRLKDRLRRAPASLDGIVDALLTKAGRAPEYLRWVTASQGQNLSVITVDKISYFKADNKYTIVMTADGEALIRRPIKELASALDPKIFWQIHRATLVNVNAIAGVTRDYRGRLTVRLSTCAETLQVSEPYAHLFRQM
jgi:DNA-binding LytR/AlgR family response regulator